ncbi:hypothetical protein GCM10008918_12430 [Lactobacillus kefiranofaciens subsp. kefiranofaciens]
MSQIWGSYQKHAFFIASMFTNVNLSSIVTNVNDRRKKWLNCKKKKARSPTANGKSCALFGRLNLSVLLK